MCNLYRIFSIVFFIVVFILPISAATVLEVTEDDFVVGDNRIGIIDDNTFVSGIQYLIQIGLIQVG